MFGRESADASPQRDDILQDSVCCGSSHLAGSGRMTSETSEVRLAPRWELPAFSNLFWIIYEILYFILHNNSKVELKTAAFQNHWKWTLFD